MRVAMYYKNSDVRVEEQPRPEIGDDELLMKVMACGVCGSDVMEWYRVRSAPRVLGHEATGEIVAVGKNVRTGKTGDRVFVSHHVPCNACTHCFGGHHTVCETLRTTNFYPGGFSEYLRVPKINVDFGTFVLPESMSYEDGTFIEPLACVFRGQKKAALKAGQSVLVIGSGLSGLLHIKLARAMDAALVAATDINEYRLKKAAEYGADLVMPAGVDVAERIRAANAGVRADLVIVCAGAESAVQQAFECVERGGTILFFAPTRPEVRIPLPVWDFWRDCLTITNSYAASPNDIRAAIALLESGTIEVADMITHRLPLAETQKGFELTAGARDSLKVVIEPQK